MDNNIQIKNLLQDTTLTCFIVPSLFSKTECENLLTESVKQSFQKAFSNYPTYYRNNERLVIDSDELAEELFEKVRPYLPMVIENQSNIKDENCVWILYRLNHRLRFCKYSANQYFHRHLDGIHYRSETEQSKLTFMIYLNNAAEFKGGRTLFYKTKETNQIWASYVPQQGDLIIFDHNIWHEGEMLEEGEKFVLRSDILYKKESAPQIPKAFGGHLGYIWEILAFNEETILSGGRDKSIKIWNKDGVEKQSLVGHDNSILCIEKLNTTCFISGSRDKKIIVWEQKYGDLFESVQIIAIHSATILSLCRISDEVFASGGGDNTIKICSIRGEVIKEFTEHTNWVWQIIEISEGIIASCAEDNTIKIWNLDSDKSIATFKTESPVCSLAYNELLKELISGDLDGQITVRTLTEDFRETNLKAIKAHNGIVRTIKIISNQLFATGGEDNKIKIWDSKTLKCRGVFEHENFVQSLELIDANILLSASYDGIIKSINLEEYMAT